MDLFEREQTIYDDALKFLDDVKNNDELESEPADVLATLVKEYGRLLKQMRRITRLSDRTTGGLNTSKLDLQDKVNYDALTGIYNRRFMEESLKQIVDTMIPSNGTLSVLMMDIDYFKKYNDTYGHSAGDDCLRIVARALNDGITRAGDFVARYGGEEFAVILPNTDESGARFIAGRMLESVREKNIMHEKNEAADCVTISIGATTGNVSRARDGGEFIKQADKALYMAKQSGRNRYVFIDFEESVK